MMEKHFVSNSDISARMFRSDFFDMFSRIHFSIPLVIYIPVVMFFFYYSFVELSIPLLHVAGLAFSGIITWTFSEYTLHRFVFHFPANSKLGKRMVFIFHGVHHDYPNDSKRLVMVPTFSIPLAVFFYFTFWLALGPVYSAPFFAGFVIGYLCYDMTHYAVHHLRSNNKLFLALKKHHLIHHYQNPEKAYGVSNVFWDFVFGTLPKRG